MYYITFELGLLTMGANLIILTGFIYFGCAIDFFIKGSEAMTIVYFGYGVANIGLYYLAKSI